MRSPLSYHAVQLCRAFVAQNCVILKAVHREKPSFLTPDLGVSSADECVDPLVSGLYASSFLASSRYNFLYSANFAKLYGKLMLVLTSQTSSEELTLEQEINKYVTLEAALIHFGV